MQAQLRFDEIESLPHNKTVAIANNFIIQTTQFLNRFSYLCEEKLAAVSRNIQRLEITMSILEAKLNSIPELDGVSASAPSATGADASGTGGASTDIAGPADSSVPEDHLDVPESDYYEDAFAESTPLPPGTMTVSDDPRYATYFKMLKLRVPVASIKQKMMMEGIDPNILDNPDAPSDASPAPAEEAPAGELRELTEDSSEELEFSD